jgi:large subunit ribosomal protein L23
MSKVASNSLYNVILGRIVTEKSSLMEAHSEYGFFVETSCNKIEIKKAVELCFGVKVERVRTSLLKGKQKTHARIKGVRKDRKKAFVRLSQGQVIDFESL